MWSFFMVMCHLDPQKDIRLWHAGGGQLAAYAILSEDPSFDFQVLAAHEWSGIEAEALAWAEERITDLRRHDPKTWGSHLVCGARQDDARRIAFLEQHGFRYRGEFAEANMLRSFDEPIPQAALPTGWRVRALAEAGEISSRAAAHREVWQPWTVGNVGDDDYATFTRLPGYHRELDVVAVAPDGALAAYVNGWLDPVNRIGDFGPVGARPAYRRQGLTRAVLAEGLRRMRSAGMDRVCVSTGMSNTLALRLYESVGFRPVNRYLDYVQQIG
jgi:mycothiol synthase